MALAERYIEEKTRYTEDEYFAFERTLPGRWEFVNGEIRQMAGGSDDHNAIANNIQTALTVALRPKGCRVYGSDMRVRTGDGINTFPDVSVVCGPRQYHRKRTDTITNPLVIVEVLSDSTAGYDRGDKFDHYATVPSLTDYLLVAQDEPRALLYTRAEGGGWHFRAVTGLESALYLPSVDIALPLTDLYALIEFGSE